MVVSKIKIRILIVSSGVIWMPFKNKGGIPRLSAFKEINKDLVLSGAKSINQSTP